MIDYTNLAKQFGGQSNTDYSALAKKFGGQETPIQGGGATTLPETSNQSNLGGSGALGDELANPINQGIQALNPLSGISELPARAIQTYGQNVPASNTLNESRNSLSGINLTLIKRYSQMPEGKQKNDMRNLIDENNRMIQDLGQQSQQLLKSNLSLDEISRRTASSEVGAAAVGAFGEGGFAELKPVFGAAQKGVGAFAKAAGTRALQTGAQFGGLQAAQDIQKGGSLNDIISNASTAFGLGALGSGLFSSFITLPAELVSSKAATSSLFRAGLGFTKSIEKQEDKTNKMASDYLIQFGGGTQKQLRTKYQTMANEIEDKIQTAIPKAQGFQSIDVISNIVNEYKKQFPTSISENEIIDYVLNGMPIDILKNQDEVTAHQLNQLRREITNKHLNPSTFKKTQLPPEGNSRLLMTAGSVMSDMVKGTNRDVLEPLFDNYHALVKAVDSGLQGSGNYLKRGTEDIIGGIAGAQFGGIPGALIGTGITELGRSTIGLTKLASVLRKSGLIIENLSRKELTQLGTTLAKLGIIKGFSSGETIE